MPFNVAGGYLRVYSKVQDLACNYKAFSITDHITTTPVRNRKWFLAVGLNPFPQEVQDQPSPRSAVDPEQDIHVPILTLKSLAWCNSAVIGVKSWMWSIAYRDMMTYWFMDQIITKGQIFFNVIVLQLVGFKFSLLIPGLVLGWVFMLLVCTFS